MSQLLNKKIQTKRSDVKTGSTFLQHPGNTPQHQEYILPRGKGLEKAIPRKWT